MAEQFWVLVIEDDPDSALFTRAALERRAGMSSILAPDAETALQALQESRFDLIICDIELPGRSGLDILPDIHRFAPGVPVIVLTAHVVVNYAVAALRGNADEFLAKPVAVETLVERSKALAAEGRRRRDENQKRRSVLAVGAHPDDVEIGVGATLAAHQAAGDDITVVIMSGGTVGAKAAPGTQKLRLPRPSSAQNWCTSISPTRGSTRPAASLPP